MSRRRYSGYHGQSGARNVLKVMAWMLVLALMLVLAGLLVGQRYLVYTDEGVRLELPFFRREQTPPDASIPVNVVQMPGKPKPQPEPPETESAQQETEAEQEESPVI